MDETRVKARVGEWSEAGPIRVESCVRWCRGALKNGPRTLRDCVLSMGMDIGLQGHAALVSNALDHLVDLGVAVKIGEKYHDDTGVKRPRVDIIPKAIGTPKEKPREKAPRPPRPPKPPKEKAPPKPPKPRPRELFSREDILGFIEDVRSGLKMYEAAIKLGGSCTTVNDYITLFGLRDAVEVAKAESIVNRNRKTKVYSDGRILTFEQWQKRTNTQKEKRERAKQNKA